MMNPYVKMKQVCLHRTISKILYTNDDGPRQSAMLSFSKPGTRNYGLKTALSASAVYGHNVQRMIHEYFMSVSVFRSVVLLTCIDVIRLKSELSS